RPSARSTWAPPLRPPPPPAPAHPSAPNSRDPVTPSDPKRALDTSLIVFLMIVAAAALTWVVPPGSFESVTLEVPGAGTRNVVVPGSYEPLDSTSPQGLGAVLRAPIRGLVEAADIVGFVLLVG